MLILASSTLQQVSKSPRKPKICYGSHWIRGPKCFVKQRHRALKTGAAVGSTSDLSWWTTPRKKLTTKLKTNSVGGDKLHMEPENLGFLKTGFLRVLDVHLGVCFTRCMDSDVHFLSVAHHPAHERWCVHFGRETSELGVQYPAMLQ